MVSPKHNPHPHPHPHPNLYFTYALNHDPNIRWSMKTALALVDDKRSDKEFEDVVVPSSELIFDLELAASSSVLVRACLDTAEASQALLCTRHTTPA